MPSNSPDVWVATVWTCRKYPSGAGDEACMLKAEQITRAPATSMELKVSGRKRMEVNKVLMGIGFGPAYAARFRKVTPAQKKSPKPQRGWGIREIARA